MSIVLRFNGEQSKSIFATVVVFVFVEDLGLIRALVLIIEDSIPIAVADGHGALTDGAKPTTDEDSVLRRSDT